MQNEYSKFSIKYELIDNVQYAVDKLNRKAKKLNVTPVKLNILDTFYKEEKFNGRVYKYKMVNVTVTGDAPVIAGWEFIAQINNDNRVVVIKQVYNVDIDYTLLKGYRNTPNKCDHCNHNRFRKNTYIVRNIETGELKQVGSSCLKDFTGHTNPMNILKFYSMLDSFADKFVAEDNYVNYGYYLDFDEIISFIAYSTRVDGFAKSYSDHATKDVALNYYYDYKNNKKWKVTPEEVDNKNAKNAIEFFKTETYPNASDNFRSYTDNVMLIIEAAEKDGMISEKHIGFIAPLVNMYFIKKNINENPSKSEFIGKIKERRIFKNLTLKSFRTFDSNFGMYAYYTFNDENGNVIVWKTTSYIDDDKVYTIKATIKDHTTYNNVNQTIITRGSIIEE